MRWDTIPPPVHDAGIIDVYLTVKDVTRPFLGISKSKWFLHFNGHITPSPIPCGQRYLVYGIRRPRCSRASHCILSPHIRTLDDPFLIGEKGIRRFLDAEDVILLHKIVIPGLSKQNLRELLFPCEVVVLHHIPRLGRIGGRERMREEGRNDGTME